MNFREILKSNTITRKIGKKLKIYYEYFFDAIDFSNNYLEVANTKKNYNYSIMLLVHSIEKGLCMENPRPFGFNKIKELIKLLKDNSSVSDYEYNLGLSILNEWCLFFKKNNWSYDMCDKVDVFLNSTKSTLIKSGSKEYYYNKLIDPKAFENIILSRSSVRKFQNRTIDIKDLETALKCFNSTPTACNRQMCRILLISSSDLKNLLWNTLIGTPGFDEESVTFFVVTYDIAALAYSGERNQGMFNAGLCSMNFINGLHVSGIGSCCLQWSNKRSEDVYIRQKLELKKSERIAIVIGAGYYLEENTIPCSIRRPLNENLKIL